MATPASLRRRARPLLLVGSLEEDLRHGPRVSATRRRAREEALSPRMDHPLGCLWPGILRSVLGHGTIADAVGMASILHYGAIADRTFEYDVETFDAEGNVEFLGSFRNHSRFQPSGIREIKHALSTAAILCRLEENNK